MADLSTYWTIFDADEAKALAKRNACLQGPRITAEDLKRGSSTVVRISAAEAMGQGGTGGASGHSASARPTAGGGRAVTGSSNRPSTKGGAVMTFGKYRGGLMADVQDEDPSYFAWCVRDIGGFAAKARAAGLLEDET